MRQRHCFGESFAMVETRTLLSAAVKQLRPRFLLGPAMELDLILIHAASTVCMCWRSVDEQAVRCAD